MPGVPEGSSDSGRGPGKVRKVPTYQYDRKSGVWPQVPVQWVLSTLYLDRCLNSHGDAGHIGQVRSLLLDVWGPRVVQGCEGGICFQGRGGRLTGPSAPAPLNSVSLLGFLLNPKFPEKVEGRFSAAPLVDLSLSPPSGLDSPNGSSSLSPERQGNGDLPAVPTAPVRRA